MTWVNAIVQGILLGGLYALFACGLSLMFGVMRIVNLAHGDLAVLAAFLAYSVMSATPLGAFWAVVVVVPVFAAFGYGLQRGLFQRSLAISPLSTLLVTFGLSVVIQNLLLQIYSADTRALDIGSLVTEGLRINANISVSYLALITFGLAVVVIIALQLFLSRSRTGRIMRAASSERRISSSEVGQSRPMPRCAVSIASATPRPSDQSRCR